MLRTFFLLSIIPVILLYWLNRVTLYDLPNVKENAYWGIGEPGKDSLDIKDYTIDVHQSIIDDAHARWKSARRRPLQEDDNVASARQSFLTNLSTVLVDFDWKQHQYFLNTFKQYTTEIEGLSIHFVRTTPPAKAGQRIVPIVLLHGFPGSYWDFFKVIPILSNPSRYGFDFGVKETILFDVIVPSLPGYIFSEKPSRSGFTNLDSARILNKLMKKLEIQKYFIHGSEGVGSTIATLWSSLYPSNVLGIHLSNPFVSPISSIQIFIKSAISEYFDKDSTTGATSLTKYFSEPQFKAIHPIVGDVLQDSPFGLVAFVMDQWRMYSSRQESTTLNSLFTLVELSILSHLYWITDTALTAIEIMYNSRDIELIRYQVRIPSAVAQSPEAPWRSPEWALRHQLLNLTSLTSLGKGGLFHHLQDPEAAAADIFRFVERVLM